MDILRVTTVIVINVVLEIAVAAGTLVTWGMRHNGFYLVKSRGGSWTQLETLGEATQ